MSLTRRIWGEVLASLATATIALIFWHGLLPWSGLSDFVRSSARWGDFGGLLLVGATYYIALVAALAGARRFCPMVNPVTAAYIGGWWVVICSASLGAANPGFHQVLGASMIKNGTKFIFYALLIGGLRYWREAALATRGLPKPPPEAPVPPPPRRPLFRRPTRKDIHGEH